MKWTVKCADRETGDTFEVIAEAATKEEAMQKVVERGHIVSSAERMNDEAPPSELLQAGRIPFAAEATKTPLRSHEQVWSGVLLVAAIICVLIGLVWGGMLEPRFKTDNAIGETANLLASVRALMVIQVAVMVLVLRKSIHIFAAVRG